MLHQYGQLRSAKAADSTLALTSVVYSQKPLDYHHHQQPQFYRTDKLVPQAPTQISTPVQQQTHSQVTQQVQQQIQRSNPTNTKPIVSSSKWLTNGPMNPNRTLCRPIPLAMSLKILDSFPHDSYTNSVSGNSLALPLSSSFESSISANQKRSPRLGVRPRLHSGSSCYESDSTDSLSDEEFGVRDIIF